MKKLLALTLVMAMGFSLAACAGKSGPSVSDEQKTSQLTFEEHVSEPSESDEQKTPQLTFEEPASEPSEADVVDENPAKTDIQGNSLTPQIDEIAKINGGADEVGIYSVVVKLTNQAADKGVIEMVYYGAEGSPQENSVVNTFRIEYCKEEAGTFEIYTFFDGETYQNMHHKDEVKVVNTFGANLRAGSVIISYTPDGGETQEIFSADADYFRPSED